MRLDVTDNPVISGMSRIFDMMCLNVLWLVCFRFLRSVHLRQRCIR